MGEGGCLDDGLGWGGGLNGFMWVGRGRVD